MDLESFGQSHKMKGDCLGLLRFISVSLFEYKFVKIILACLFVIHGGVMILTIFSMHTLTKQELVTFSVTFLPVVYPMVALAEILFKGQLIVYIKKDIILWDINTVGETARQKMERKIHFLNVYVIISTNIIIFAGYSYVEDLQYDDQLFYVLYFLKMHFPSHSYVLCKIYKWTFPLLGYVTFVHAFVVIYYTQHCIFQGEMFAVLLTKIDEYEVDINEEELYYNLEYQKYIKEHTTFGIKRGVEFLLLLSKKINDIGYFFFGFCIGGILFGIGSVLYLFSECLSPAYFLRISFTVIGAGLVFSGLIWTGQETQSEIERFGETLLALKWYNYNKSNRNIYLVSISLLSKNHSLRFSEKYALNYELGLAIVKNIYSVLSVAVNMYH